jgi:hypothetical protein
MRFELVATLLRFAHNERDPKKGLQAYPKPNDLMQTPGIGRTPDLEKPVLRGMPDSQLSRGLDLFLQVISSLTRDFSPLLLMAFSPKHALHSEKTIHRLNVMPALCSW